MNHNHKKVFWLVLVGSLALAVLFDQRPLWAQGPVGTGEVREPKSLIPPARPKADPGVGKKTPPIAGPQKERPWFETDQERYFLRADPVTWSTAAHDFALDLKAEFDRFRRSGSGGLEWPIDEIFDYVEVRFADLAETNPELDPYELAQNDVSGLTTTFIEEFLNGNVDGLAIDGTGNYFILFKENDPAESQWLSTSVNTSSSDRAESLFFDQEIPRAWEADNQGTSRRYEAATEAWRNNESEQ
jgi:hypothetical protein